MPSLSLCHGTGARFFWIVAGAGTLSGNGDFVAAGCNEKGMGEPTREGFTGLADIGLEKPRACAGTRR